MSFWEELRQQVKEHTTAGDLCYQFHGRLAATPVNEMAVIRPTFFLSQFSVQTHDYMDLVEKLLGAGESDLRAHLTGLLYLREAARSLARLIREASEPLEIMIACLEELYEARQAVEEGEEAHEEEEGEETGDDFAAEKTQLEALLRSRFSALGLADSVGNELSARLAEVYRSCVRLARAEKALTVADPEDLEEMLTVLTEMQYIIDFEMRKVLLEEIFLDETPTFVSGLFTWMSHAVEELVRRVAAQSSPVLA